MSKNVCDKAPKTVKNNTCSILKPGNTNDNIPVTAIEKPTKAGIECDLPL